MQYEYIETSEQLAKLVRRLAAEPLLGVDTEAAGYHRYLDRISLLQVSSRSENFLVDPLAIDDLSPLGSLLADRAIEKVFHDADYDLRILDRDLSVTVVGLFDTQIAAAFLGERALGLGALVERFLGPTLPKAFQRADWAARPLSEGMKDYAATDTAYLPQLRDALRERLIERTGNPAITGFQLPKVVWLRSNEPAAFARVRRVMLPKAYVGLVLTGEAVAEPSDASGTGAYHLATGSWDAEVLGAVGLDTAMWPRLVKSDDVVGGLLGSLARRVGLKPGTPVVAGAGDNAAAATGLALGRQHLAVGSVSLGTSGVLFAPLEEPRPDPQGRVHLFAHADGGFNLLGVTLSAGGSLRWFRDVMARGRLYDELLALAAGSAPGAGGVTFKPYLAGERTPHMRPDLRASFHGLSLATGLEDLVRAVLEGVAFSLRESLDVMAPLARPERWLATGGGARSDLWLQILADALASPVGRPVDAHDRVTEVGAAEGAAWLAWRGLGHAPKREPRAAGWFEPDAARSEVVNEAFERYRESGLS